MRSLTTAAALLALSFATQLLAAPVSAAQAEKERGSITGQVKVDGKPAKDITVIANPSIGDPSKLVESMLNKSASLKATTDSDGRYKFEDVPVGKYRLVPFAPLLVSASIEYGSEVTVTADSKTEGIDFSLLPGGVVTGKLTDSEGRPVIGEKISLKPVKDPAQPALDVRLQAAAGASVDSMMSAVMGGGRMYTTDDRGVYRIFGLLPGRYLVSAGGDSDVFSTMFKLRQKRIKTFYPGVNEEAQARQVEVKAGSEATGIDIQFSLANAGLSVSGRVVDAEKGTPIANTMVAYSRAPKTPNVKSDSEESGVDVGEMRVEGLAGTGFTTTNDKGEFRFGSVAPGSYKLEVTQIGAMTGIGTSEFYGDPVSFEVRGANVYRLEVKMHRGASISGVVVVEDAEEQSGLQSFGRISMSASVMDTQTNSHSTGVGVVGEDGTFRIGGLKAGKVMIRPFSMGEKQVALARIERNSIELQGGIDIQANEQITGVRVVLTSANCVIRGHVTIQGGSLPSGGRLTVVARRLHGGAVYPSDTESGEVDAKGDFVIEDLAPATYEVEAFVFMPAREGMRSASAKQTVTASKNGPTNVELVLDLSRTDK
ncbi:MAG TPA: hypothetical protein VGL29_02130 [Blastocatellia bacterium]|jgi:protocatechuate 3,4-dioxygenase beta subunit